MNTSTAAAAIVMLLILWPVLAFLGGAFSGLVVGWCFPDAFGNLMQSMHLTGMAPWQFGGMVAWIGSFFRATSSK